MLFASLVHAGGCRIRRARWPCGFLWQFFQRAEGKSVLFKCSRAELAVGFTSIPSFTKPLAVGVPL
jgi:hypothetical protein